MSSSRKTPPTKFDKFYSVDTNSGEVSTRHQHNNNSFSSPSFSSSTPTGTRTPPPHKLQHNNNNNNFFTSPSSTSSASVAQGTGSSAVKGLRSLPGNSLAHHNNNNHQPPRSVVFGTTSSIHNNNTKSSSSSNQIMMGTKKETLLSFVDTQTGSIALKSLHAELTKEAENFLSPISWAEALLDEVHIATESLNVTRPDCISTGAALVTLDVLGRNIGSYSPILQKIHQQLESAIFQKNSYDANTAYFDLYRSSLAKRLWEVRRPQKAVAQAFDRSNKQIKRAVFVSWRSITRKKNIARESGMTRAILTRKKKNRECLKSHLLAWKHYMSLKCRVLTSDETKTQLVFRLSRYAKQIEKELYSCQEFCQKLITDNRLSVDRISESVKKWDEFKDWWLLFDQNQQQNDDDTLMIGDEGQKQIENNNNNKQDDTVILSIEDTINNHQKTNPVTVQRKLSMNTDDHRDSIAHNNSSSSHHHQLLENETQNHEHQNQNQQQDDPEEQQLLDEDAQLQTLQKLIQGAKEENDKDQTGMLIEGRNPTEENDETLLPSSSPKPFLQNLESRLDSVEKDYSLSTAQQGNNPAQREIEEAQRIKKETEEKHEKELHKHFNPHEILDWVSSRIQCVSVTLDLPSNKKAFAHQFSSSSSTASVGMTGQKICSNFTSDFQGKTGLEKLARFAVSLGAPRKIIDPLFLSDDNGQDNNEEERDLIKKHDDEKKSHHHHHHLAMIVRELNDLLLEARSDLLERRNNERNNNTTSRHLIKMKNNNDKKNIQQQTSAAYLPSTALLANNTTNLLHPQDIASLRGRKVAMFLNEMYHLFKHVPVNIIPKRDPHQKRLLALLADNRPEEEKLSLVGNSNNNNAENDGDEVDPLLLLERHVEAALANHHSNNNQEGTSLLLLEDSAHNNNSTNDPDPENLHHQNNNNNNTNFSNVLPSQKERDELTKWYSELAAEDSDLDSEVIEEEMAAEIDQEEEYGNDENNDDDDIEKARKNRERNRARTRRMKIPTTEEIIERTLKRSQRVLSEEWSKLEASQRQSKNNNISKKEITDGNSNDENDNTNRNSFTISSSVKQKALLEHRLSQSHKQMIHWVENAVDAMSMMKKQQQNSIINNNTNSRHLVPDHHYIHNQQQRSSSFLSEATNPENNISTLEMLDSVLKTIVVPSSSSSAVSSENNNTNDHHQSISDEVQRRRRYLLSVERLLHEEVKMRNVRLRSPVGVTNTDTVLSMRQLMTALYVLKGGKNFVVVV